MRPPTQYHIPHYRHLPTPPHALLDPCCSFHAREGAVRHFVRRPAALSHRPQLSNVEPQLRDSRGPKGRAGWGRGVSNTTCNQGTAHAQYSTAAQYSGTVSPFQGRHTIACATVRCLLAPTATPYPAANKQKGVHRLQVQRKVLQVLKFRAASCIKRRPSSTTHRAWSVAGTAAPRCT